MSNLPEQAKQQAIVVDPEGDAYVEYTRQKESLIVSERLDDQNPILHVDLEKILTEEGGAAIAVVVEDFGLPPRLIEISGDFTSMRDVSNLTRNDQHYRSAPECLNLRAPAPDSHDNQTYVFDSKLHAYPEYGGVELSRGESMLFAHEGEPSDQRVGYIGDDWYGLTVLRPRDYYGEADFSDINTIGLRGSIPLIGVTYEGHTLSLYSLDNVHAQVLYQQVRSLEDTMTYASEAEGVLDTDELLARLKGADEAVYEELSVLMTRGNEAEISVRALTDQLDQARQAVDSLETLLVVNKSKLRDARYEAAELQREVERLKRAEKPLSQTGKKQGADSQPGNNDPYGLCTILGLNADFLFELAPQNAIKIVKGVHRGLVMQFHSDVKGGDDEGMKKINNAVDTLISRLEQGYWA